MKTSVLIIVFVLIGMSTGHTQQVRKPAPAAVTQRKVDTLFPKEVVKFLGDTVINVIQNADSVQAFVLNPQSNEQPQLEGFTVVQKLLMLSKNQINQLHQLIGNRQHWVFNNTAKLCPFVPNLGVVFSYRGERVTILVCLTCNMWRFVYQHQAKTEDCDPAHPAWLSFARSIFPGEASYKNLR